MISHRNIISNIMQISTFERPWRRHNTKKGEKEWMEIVLGLLPQSHIYGLVFVCHVSTYRGDQVIVLPKFELDTFLSSIQRFKIDLLFLVSRKRGRKNCAE
jgi:long-subunit acyl-CoA synthetase (AMP-forming)